VVGGHRGRRRECQERDAKQSRAGGGEAAQHACGARREPQRTNTILAARELARSRAK
jgi:hypothetical protein